MAVLFVLETSSHLSWCWQLIDIKNQHKFRRGQTDRYIQRWTHRQVTMVKRMTLCRCHEMFTSRNSVREWFCMLASGRFIVGMGWLSPHPCDVFINPLELTWHYLSQNTCPHLSCCLFLSVSTQLVTKLYLQKMGNSLPWLQVLHWVNGYCMQCTSAKYNNLSNVAGAHCQISQKT